MNVGWQLKSLGNVCVVDKLQGINKGLPYVGLEHIESMTGRFLGSTDPFEVKSTTFKFTQKHILYGRLRPYLNKVLLPNFTGHCSTEIFPILPLPGLLRKFLYYWFIRQVTVELIDATATGARMPRANMNAVLDLQIPLPPLTVQKRIVAILDEAFTAIDQVITNTEKNLKNILELADYIIDLTVQGNLSQRHHSIKSVKDLLAQMNGEKLKRQGEEKGKTPPASELKSPPFDLPEQWQWVHLHEVTHNISDGVHKKPNYVPEGVPFVMVNNLTAGPGISFDSVKYISQDDHKEFIKRTHPERGDILITKDGTIGVVRLIDIDTEFSLFVSVALIKPVLKTISAFLALALSAPSIQKQIVPAGTALKHLYLTDLRQLWVPIPPLDEQEHIMAQYKKVSQHVCKVKSIYKQKLKALSELKQSILHKAFTGELTDNLPL